jgi:iron complex outermembrane recepter protein
MASKLSRQLLASTAAFGVLISAAPAWSQTAPQESAPATDEAEQDVVVTGSRINRPDLQQASPVSVLSEAELSLRQPQSIEQVLRQLPGTSAGIGTQVNNGQGGVSTFNLRGLGSNRNLVLLNNRRIVPSTLGNVVDLNIIPVALIERSDILTGGAVTSYGADAIAGVVNFVTKQNFQGVDVRANYGVTERGDGQTYRIDFLTGANFDEGKGNVLFAASYTNVKAVLQGDRDIGQFSRQSTCTAAQNAAAGGCAAATLGINQGSNTAVPASLFAPLPTTGPFAAGAQFDPATGTIAPGLSDYNFNPLNLFQTPNDRWSIYGAAHYEFLPNVEFFSEGFYTRSRVVQNLAPTGSFTNPFQVPLNNPFLTAAQRTQLCTFANIANCPAAIAAGQEITAIVARRFVETGPRVATFESNLFQINAGLRGKLVSNLRWEAFVQYGEANRRNVSTGTALADRLQAGLRSCPAGSPAGCVPVNIFGAAGTMTPAMLNYLGVPTSTFINTRFADVQGLITGDFGFHTPWTDKPLSIAFGGEYRRYSGGQFGDLPSSTPGQILGSGGAFTTINGSYFSREGFGEINFPLITDKAFFKSLNIEAGFRYADYSNSGGNWTYKFGGNYSPIKEITFRGTYTRAVRAPNLGELFQPVVTGLNNLAVDPCQGANGTANATVSALCTAQLAAAGLPASRLGAIPAPIAGQINVTTGGNPNLRPEEATTYTVGLVIQPGDAFGGIFRGFTATVDWYEINVTGAITSPTVGDIVNGCFSQANPNDTRCTLIRRNPLTGGLSGDPASTQGVIQQQSNLGFLQTRGVDFTASYQRRFGAVNMNWSFNGNYTDRSRFQSNPSSFIRECVGFYSVSCDPVLPQWSWNLRTTASVDAFDFSILWRHIDPTRYEPRTSATQPAAGTVGSFGSTNPTTIVGAYRQIPAFNYLDFSLGINVNKNLRLGLLVENLLDDNAPDVGNTIGTTTFNSGNTFPSVYDPLGRRFLFSTQVRF